jgi:5-methylcytosine-specific restriction endonuclease McrA
MKFELKPYTKSVSKDEIIKDFQKVAGELGKKSVTQREYVKHGKYSAKTVYAKFGSWKDALNAANLYLSSNIGSFISNEELFANLEEVWIKLGRQPSYNEMIKPLSKYHACTYERRFKGWRKALENFVKYVNSEDKEFHPSEIEAIEGKHETSKNINLRLRFKVLYRDNFKCGKCGRSPATNPKIELHVDHIKPYSKGGETELSNLQTLCSDCNQGKSNLYDV